ncbi:DUF445 family protein [Panacagrimonas sp.]|uniref:DUF445 family protein n=1 Tax=Panacagrimonas sp. TaxID=2480088 RepID=UPI003B52FC48
MMQNLDAWDRHFRHLLLGAAVLLGGLDWWAEGGNPWLRSAFVIAVAGCVGYFTNFLAIKMLFQPRQGAVLGWRGLIPKNQAEIARSLGESVQSQLLAPDIVLAYIAEHQLIERGSQALIEWVDANLQKPEVRREITAALIGVLNERGAELLKAGFDLGEEAAKGIARNPQVIEVYWQRVRAALTEFLQVAENRQMVTGLIRRALNEQMPTIAGWVDRAIQNYLQQKRAMGRFGLGLKNLLSIDQTAIEQLLGRFVEDAGVADDVLVVFDAVMKSVQADLADDTKQAELQRTLQRWVETVSELSRRHLLPATVEHMGSFLNDETNWTRIEALLVRALEWLKGHAASLLHGPTGQAYLRAAIERAVQQIDVTRLVEQQIMKLDSDDLEKLVLNNTGGNLTIIQTLGGALGLVIGFVQVHLLFALPLGAAAGAVWIAWELNEQRHRRH